MSTYPSPDGDLMVMMFADGSHLQIGADDKAAAKKAQLKQQQYREELGADVGVTVHKPTAPPRIGYNGCCLNDCTCDPDYEFIELEEYVPMAGED